ncbi:MAG: hypothetical protein KKG60_03370 [Nanoarchaeota archaeon]|nr:hypothetical protein [Nanoarchaeota archaeon]
MGDNKVSGIVKLEDIQNTNSYALLMKGKNKVPLIKIKDNKKPILLITSVKNTNIGIKNPKFPFDFRTKSGARFIAAIMGDGEINKQINVRYNNQNKKLIRLVLKSAQDIFGGVDFKIYERGDKTFQLHFPKIVGLITIRLGLKPGYKSKTNYKIPSFILKSKKEIKAIFLRQFFNDEGSIRLSDRRLQIKQTLSIKISKERCRKNPGKYCHNFLKGIKQLFDSFEISSNIALEGYRNEKVDFGISVYGKENLEKFQKEIGSDIEEKRNNLDKAIKNYKFPSAPRNKRLLWALDKFKKIQNKRGYVTKCSLSEESQRSIKTATSFLVDLKKQGKIREIEKPRNKKGHFLPRKYVWI